MSRYEFEKGVLDGFEDNILPFVSRFSFIVWPSNLQLNRTGIPDASELHKYSFITLVIIYGSADLKESYSTF
jgi:hypothetical protein